MQQTERFLGHKRVTNYDEKSSIHLVLRGNPVTGSLDPEEEEVEGAEEEEFADNTV